MTIVRLARVDSTQRIAFELAAGGAADGTVEAAGRGRRGRAWDALPGTSLLCTIVVRPSIVAERWPAYSLATAVAVADMLERVAELGVRLKWPNDVLVGGRKIAGILLESRLSADVAGVIAVGIGVNLGQRAFPAALAARATSVALERGTAVERDAALAALLTAFGEWRCRLEADGVAPVRERWLALADTIGRRVSVDGVSGVAVDLDADGALVLEDGERRHRVLAGELAGV
jgi:BirA family transcriptional regulator, biotin operon repressor / biotin---[acetyl-CoA-carboxylase] ligase